VADQTYHLYVLRCDQRILYTGIAIDPEARLLQHQAGPPLGAKFTRRFKQLELLYQVKIGNRSEAQSVELAFKKLPRKEKLAVITAQLNRTKLFHKLLIKGEG